MFELPVVADHLAALPPHVREFLAELISISFDLRESVTDAEKDAAADTWAQLLTSMGDRA